MAGLQGSIPYVPFLRAPYYIWIGRVPQLSTILAEPKTEAPSGFPATFLYTMSWEDPRPDMQVCPPCTCCTSSSVQADLPTPSHVVQKHSDFAHALLVVIAMPQCSCNADQH